MKQVKKTIYSMMALGILFTSCGGENKTETPKTEEIKTEVAKEVEVPTAENSATEGKAIFDSKCVACHKIDEKLIGPALKGVTSRRTDEWIVKMIVDPANMLANDPDAKKLLSENNNVPMVVMNVSEVDAHKVLDYLKSLK